MNHPHLDQAREWAAEIAESRQTNIRPDAFAAARVIQSLPDEWIDAEELRELVVKYEAFAEDAEPEGEKGRIRAALYRNFVGVLEALLLTPPLPTLAELIEAGNDPQKYVGMQCMMHDFPSTRVITKVRDSHVSALREDLEIQHTDTSKVTPLPDLPKLEWPGSHADTITAESVEDMQAGRVADFEPALPRPEDVPAGEPWIVLCGGKKWVGVRSADSEYVPWSIVRMDGLDNYAVPDSEITLVSRLVPEVGA